MDGHKNKELLHATEADRSKWTMHSNHNIKRFTEIEIERITGNYKTILGRGGFGEVFKGVLEDKSMVAVKKLNNNVKENFDKELLIHREINHKNVVRLIGYCVEENALMMVTEFISNGNLTTILHHDNTPIPLDVRLRIAIQCAEALAYMHSDMYTQVIHGDIKPDNILLDGNLNAKISDFGISRLVNRDKTQHTENVIGSKFYIDPLFIQDGRLTPKNDVYSFGVVLLELLTRKNAATEVTDGEASSLVTIFSKAHKRGRIKDVRKFLDSELDPWRNKNILDDVGKLAAECLVLNREERIEMKHVVERLGKAMKASLQGKQSVAIFNWSRKPAWTVNIPATARSLPRFRRFSSSEIVAATRNFDESQLLGQGSFGTFYRGVINGATMVTIERWGHRYNQDFFHAYVQHRSKLYHINILPLIGYCVKNGERTLVYHYMDQGSLGEHLFGTRNPLTWKQRLEISIGAARGLHYLHTCGIIHRDLSPENILLGKDLVAKITGYQMTDPPLTRIWTEDYNARDPMLDLTEKSDVYSFGAVLLEVLCAQRHFKVVECNMEGWASSCMMDFNLIDSYIKGTIDPKCFTKFVETAFKCVSGECIDRPSMEVVVSALESALQLQVSAEASGSDVMWDVREWPRRDPYYE